MALSNEQYQSLMRAYDERRMAHLREQRAHAQEVAEKVPGYKALSDAITENAAARARAALQGEDLSALTREGDALKKERDELYRASGFPADYLELKYDCPDCKDTGYIDGKRCHCLVQKTAKILSWNSNLSDFTLTQENFDTLSMDYYDRTPFRSGKSQYELMADVIARCKAFAADFGSAQPAESLLFYGPSGTGKTFLSNCIAKELLERCYSVVYYSAEQLISRLADEAFRNNGDAEEEISALIRDCDLLIIDDLGTERVNSFSVSRLFTIINDRLNLGKSTLISTNLNPDQLRDLYTERVSSRLVSRYELLEFGGNDIRIVKKYGRGIMRTEKDIQE